MSVLSAILALIATGITTIILVIVGFIFPMQSAEAVYLYYKIVFFLFALLTGISLDIARALINMVFDEY